MLDRANNIPKMSLYFFPFLLRFAVWKFSHSGYLAQYGHSPFSLWCRTHASQSPWRGQSFFGQGQFGAVTGIDEHLTALGNKIIAETSRNFYRFFPKVNL
jgi:hypothetical protein